MKDDENKDKLRLNIVNEPIVGYGVSSERRLSVFTSFEEAAEADHEFYRNLSPEQRLNIHYELSLQFYDEAKSSLKGRFSF